MNYTQAKVYKGAPISLIVYTLNAKTWMKKPRVNKIHKPEAV